MKTIRENCEIAQDVIVGDYSIIGEKARPDFDFNTEASRISEIAGPRKTTIDSGCFLGSYVLIEEGVSIGKNCIVESYVHIRENTVIGESSLITYGAKVGERSTIGAQCVIGGFVCDGSRIGVGSRVFGQLIHKHEDPSLPWDGTVEPAPILGEKVFVGFGAMVIGGITISSNVYVVAGSTVTKNVPANSVAYGINQIINISSWTGKLKNSNWWEK